MSTPIHRVLTLLLTNALFATGNAPALAQRSKLNFDEQKLQEVRSLLSNRCFACHGPDEEQREGGFRLDEAESYFGEADSGEVPVKAGEPGSSELLRRIESAEDYERMPPPEFGAALTEQETQLVREWIAAGAELSTHWSFKPPSRPALPPLTNDTPTDWRSNPIDRFVLRRMRDQGLSPSPRASQTDLLRRLHLDICGLPPRSNSSGRSDSSSISSASTDELIASLLASPKYGEHWARKWLDLARYADSAGYADDPPRTIWAYRDWVIRAINENMPLDEFTASQLAGDLLPSPTEDQLIATAFHRNTLTNNEGGTNDEEFRNVAVVDRVNTTMAVWMGITMACAQCHTHKYDPYSQEEYFKLFAILNQTQDADKRDERPTLPIFTAEQKQRRIKLEKQRIKLEQALKQWTPELESEYQIWLSRMKPTEWETLPIAAISQLSSGSESELSWSAAADNLIVAGANKESLDRVPAKATVDVSFTVPDSLRGDVLTALALETVPQANFPGSGAGLAGGNFVLTSLDVSILDQIATPKQARYVRIELPGEKKILSLAEVEVFSRGVNVAKQGTASQSSTDFAGEAELAVDQNRNGIYADGSVTHSKTSDSPWWELDLKETIDIGQISIWNRTDNDLSQRLNGAVITLLTNERKPVDSITIEKAGSEFQWKISPSTAVPLHQALADYSQPDFDAALAVDNKSATGWAVGGQVDSSHRLTLTPRKPFGLEPGQTLNVRLAFESRHKKHLLGAFRVSVTTNELAGDWARLSPDQRQHLSHEPKGLSKVEDSGLKELFQKQLSKHTLSKRRELASVNSKLEQIRPSTSVPILRERGSDEQRETFVQIRGNYKAQGKKVSPGVPEIFHPLPNSEKADRLALAKWLVCRDNPLTARVWVNRLWESIFGLGLVRTSEEFGAQGDLPSHPELLDWLAVEFMESGWDTKHILQLIFSSQTYQQTSEVSPAVLAQDQDNIWLSRGPRVRLSAEMVRDQALASAGLLSNKMFGPPVRPPQPDLGLKAAFGSKTDWQPSKGEDRYRRGLYTTWRRSSPYPSMVTFDAPSREVCTLKRETTNTPLQALVTLNDPGFVEAAQALARRVSLHESTPTTTPTDCIRRMFELTTSREPTADELEILAELYEMTASELSDQPDQAMQLSTQPLGPLPPGADSIQLAALTVVGNVLLNLDEVLMKR
ncbi:MAG: DUF1553 domain-containing protein [Aureliella sp.]